MEVGLILPKHVDENVRVVVYATLVLRGSGPVECRRTVQYFDSSDGPGQRIYRDQHIAGLDDELYEWLNDTLRSAYKIGQQLEQRYHPSLPIEEA